MDASDDDSITEHLFAVNQAAAILITAESDSDSDAEIDERRTRWGGSVKGKAKNKERGFDEAYQKIAQEIVFLDLSQFMMKVILRGDFACLDLLLIALQIV